MPIDAATIERVRTRAHEHARDTAQARADISPMNLTAAQKRQAVADVKPPLVTIHDRYHFHFFGDDAKTVAAAVPDLTSASPDGVKIDSRDWNAVLPILEAAGHHVVQTDGNCPE